MSLPTPVRSATPAARQAAIASLQQLLGDRLHSFPPNARIAIVGSGAVGLFYGIKLATGGLDVRSKLDYRSSPEALQDKFRQAGADGLGLLQWLEGLRSDLRYGTQVEQLAEVVGQRFALKDNRPEPLEQSEGSAVQSPHDPNAQYAAKGRGKQPKAWLGYKAQVAETLPEEGQPPFLVSVVTQKATQGDEPGPDQTLAAQAQSGLGRPTELYADGGYISDPRLQRAAQQGWSLLGPAKASPRRPGVDRWLVEAFRVDITHRQACCPAGHPSGHCSRLQVRQEQASEAFQHRMHQRNAIEGTLSELTRGQGTRRSRYRGFGKVELGVLGTMERRVRLSHSVS